MAEKVAEAILGVSPAMQEVRRQIVILGPEKIPVHTVAPTGAGKELVARQLHDVSGRRGAFLPINCGGVTETLAEDRFFGHLRGAFTDAHTDRPGLFEMAHQGTLFLDEIDKLPISAQASLLRVLDDGRITRLGSSRSIEVDFRLVTATNRDLEKLVTVGSFLPDLFYRLTGPIIVIPPLAERPEDIPILAWNFLRRSRLSDAACVQLLRYAWPGNVRQLKATIETAEIYAGEEIRPEHLPPRVRTKADGVKVQGSRPFDIEANVKALVSAALESTGHDIARAASLLGIHRTTLARKIREWGW